MPQTGPLTLTGNLAIGVDDLTAVDVSNAIYAMTIEATRDVVAIAATLGTPKSSRAGGVEYTLKLEFQSADGDDDDLFRMLWDSLITADGILYFHGSVTDEVVSATNRLFSGRFLVTGAAIGGAAEGESKDSRTFPMLERPTVTTTP